MRRLAVRSAAEESIALFSVWLSPFSRSPPAAILLAKTNVSEQPRKFFEFFLKKCLQVSKEGVHLHPLTSNGTHSKLKITAATSAL